VIWRALLVTDFESKLSCNHDISEAELHNLKERIESRKGLRQLSYMKEMGMGNNQHELITL
jgi:hypothetical protein